MGSEATREKDTVREASLSEVRAFLESGAAWPGEAAPECIETHASLVFLTRDRAWKLKKPVRLMHVDQVSRKARTWLSQEEVRLNRELSGDTYRGLTPIVRRPDGTLALGGDGYVVDLLIESVRLPATEMLDHRLTVGPTPELSEIEALCDTLVQFYRRQPKPSDAGDVFYRRLLRDHGIAATNLREMASATQVPAPEPTLSFAIRTLSACHNEIIERGRQGYVVEGHGDLRAEHVCLTEPPVVFDRLEIDHNIRVLDPFYELNALGLECAMLGASWIRAALLARLSQTMAPPSRNLLSAYGVMAFLTRARIAADHFRDIEIADPEKWRTRTRQSLAAAAHLVAQADKL